MTDKLKILLCNEASFFKTGYSKYGRELMRYLYDTDKYELAEHASYADPLNPSHIKQAEDYPWPIYFNIPRDQEARQRYESNKNNVFGSFLWEQTCVEFQPDAVISFRDTWMDSHILNSSYRRLYNFCWMPTCDSYPQNQEWLSQFQEADGIFTYTDWSKKVLEDSGIGVLDSCPPSCSDKFVPLNKEQTRNSFGMNPNLIVIGTIMRNQRRKLFSDLFSMFKQLLLKSKQHNTFLYCHTSYPDRGWELNRLLLEHGISNKVLFTYICRNCNYYTFDFWNDALTFCPKCNQKTLGLPHVKFGLSDEQMSHIINCFDLYLQYANSEGFGIPMVEAAACGVPIAAINYSACEDVIQKLEGISLPVKDFIKEMETGCNRAYPDNTTCASILNSYLNKEMLRKLGLKTRSLYEKYYNWEETCKKWMNYLDSVKKSDWKRPPWFHQPSRQIPPNLNNAEYIQWLIINVLGDPSKLGSFLHARLVRDLNWGQTKDLSGMYYNEDSILFSEMTYQEFNRETAYKYLENMCQHRNYWEKKRMEFLGL